MFVIAYLGPVGFRGILTAQFQVLQEMVIKVQ